MVKNLPAMWETQVQSLGQEDPLEEEMVTHSSILAQRIPWTEEPDGLQSMGSQGVRHDRVTNTLVHSIVIFPLLFKIYNSFFTVKCALHPTFIGSMFSTRWKLWESRNCHIVPYVYSSPQHQVSSLKTGSPKQARRKWGRENPGTTNPSTSKRQGLGAGRPGPQVLRNTR